VTVNDLHFEQETRKRIVEAAKWLLESNVLETVQHDAWIESVQPFDSTKVQRDLESCLTFGSSMDHLNIESIEVKDVRLANKHAYLILRCVGTAQWLVGGSK
jgi:hypothetical protein